MIREPLISIGLLMLRIGSGGIMALVHGLPKLLGFAEMSTSFPDPIGFGSPASLSLAIFAELFCGLLVVVGLATRFASLPLIVTMLVAAFVVHGDDPFQKKELALVYLIPFVTLLIAGPGTLSLDRIVQDRKKPKGLL